MRLRENSVKNKKKNSIAVSLIWVVWDIIKNDGRDWTHFEMPIWHFILVKWVCISRVKLNLLTKGLVLSCHIFA